MKKWLKSLSKEQVQRYVFVGLLVLVFVAFFVSVGIANNTEKPSDDINNTDDGNKDNTNDNNNNNDDNQNNQQVPNTPEPKKEVINLPLSNDFIVVRKYYDPEDSTEEQELAVIQFGKRYYTSDGIALTTKN